MVRIALVLGLAGSLASPLEAQEEPTIDHQPVECTVPGKHTRICASVLDDGEVKRVRVYFRAERQDAYYWSAMSFDGIQFCSTLPIAKNSVRSIDYYVWAVDDEFQITRTRPHEIRMGKGTPCSYPVVDEDPVRTQNLVVNATSDKQGGGIKEFEKDGIKQFVAAKKR